MEISRPIIRNLLHRHGFLLLITTMAGLFCLTSLGNRYLWQDEASTAVGARNVLKYGYPSYWDGRSYADDPGDIAGRVKGFYTVHPPLPYYLSALSFALLGPGTATARLPFSLLGVALVPLLYAYIRYTFRDQSVAHLTILLFTLNIPMLLHVRQARYYAILMFAGIWFLFAYQQMMDEQKKTALWHMTLAAVAMFFTHYTSFAALMLAVTVHWLWIYRGRYFGQFFRSMLITAIAAFAWLVFTKLYSTTNAMNYAAVTLGHFSFHTLSEHVTRFLKSINDYMFPLVMLIPVVWVSKRGLSRRYVIRVALVLLWGLYILIFADLIHLQVFSGWFLVGLLTLAGFAFVSKASSAYDKSVLLLLLVVLCTIVVSSFMTTLIGSWFFRYIITSLPVLMILLALIVARAYQTHKGFGLLVVALLVLTNAVHLFPLGWVRAFPQPLLYFAPIISDTPLAYGAALATGRSLSEAQDRTQVERRLQVIDDHLKSGPRIQFYPVQYVKELVTDYDNGEEGVSKYLNQHGRPGDILLANYQNAVYIFYTDLKVVFSLDLQDFRSHNPDWIVVHDALWAPVSDSLRQEIEKEYEWITFDFPATLWGNRPDLDYHYFTTPNHLPRQGIYKRRVSAR